MSTIALVFSYSTQSGMSRTETGGLTASGWGVVGSYQYRDTDGALYKVSFTADHNGYRPRSDLRQGYVRDILTTC